MSGIIRLLDQYFEEVASVIMLSLLVVLLCLQVVLRFVFHIGLAWNEEVARFVFVWFCYFGASLGVQRQGHIRITTFLTLLPEGRTRRFAVVISDLIWLVFNLFIVVLGFQLIRTMTRFEQLSPALGINMIYLYMIIPLSFVLMSFRLAQIYYRNLRDRYRTAAPNSNTQTKETQP